MSVGRTSATDLGRRLPRRGRRLFAVGVVLFAVFMALVVSANARTSKSKIPTHTFVDLTAALPPAVDCNIVPPTTTSSVYAPNWCSALLRSKGAPTNAKSLPGPYAVDPYLAQSWKRSSNGSYTFTLRKGVKSPYGHVLSTADVVYSVNRWLGVKDPVAADRMRVGAIDTKNPITVVNARTFRLNVTAPSPLTLPVLASNNAVSIYDSAEMKAHATASDPWSVEWAKSHSAGFGAYVVSGFVPAQSIELKANPNFFGKKPYFTRVELRAVADPSVRLQLMLSGDGSHTDGLNWDQFKAARDSGKAHGVAAILKTSGTVDTMVLNEKYPPLANVLVRKAISMGIDRSALNKSIYLGFGKPAPYVVASSLVPGGVKLKPNTHNVAAAKQLLAQAGYPDGFNLQIVGFPSSVISNELVLLQSQLAQIGIKVTINIPASPAGFTAIRNVAKSHQAAVLQQGPSIADPLYRLATQTQTGAVVNLEAISDSKADALYNALFHAPRGPRYNRLMNQLLTRLNDQAPILNLVELPTQNVTDASIGGWLAYPYPTVYYEYLHR